MSQGGEVSCLKDWLSNSMNSYPDIHGEDGFHRARISFGASWKLSRTFSNNFSVKVVLIIDLLDFKNLMSSTKSKTICGGRGTLTYWGQAGNWPISSTNFLVKVLLIIDLQDFNNVMTFMITI